MTNSSLCCSVDLQPDHLAGAQPAAIAEPEQDARWPGFQGPGALVVRAMAGWPRRQTPHHDLRTRLFAQFDQPRGIGPAKSNGYSAIG